MASWAVPNHAAFTPDSVDDARRGYPAVDLAAYGLARHLDPIGQALVGHFSGLNPVWPNYVFNVLRGELVPGRFGTVQHELYEIGLGDDGEPTQPGTYFGRRSTTNLDLSGLIGLIDDVPNEPFAAQAMWVPTTGFKVLVPEVAVLPRIVIGRKGHTVFTDPSLDPWAPSYRMRSSQWITPELRDAVAAALGPALETVGTAFARVEVKNGALGLVVDGFRADPADLDRLVAITRAMAGAIAEVARPWWSPAPFDQPLPAFDRGTHPPGYRSFENDLEHSGLDAMVRDAAELGLTVEDPAMLHRRFPRLPLPGTSMGVLGGFLPGTGSIGRLTWQNQSHPASSAYLRPAAVVQARPEAPLPPTGGGLVASTDMYVAVVDGIAGCWTRTNSVGRLDTADLLARALATLRETGLAVI